MTTDPWLDRWLPRLIETAGNGPVLEIGCGAGADTVTLTQAGLQVVAFDLSPAAVAVAQRTAPAARITVQSVKQPFPLEDTGVGVVIASLSLHYFRWSETLDLIVRIRNTLKPDGLFLCRLNSTEDHHYGAHDHPEIEPGLYSVDGQPKRFFSETDIQRLFQTGWRVLSCEHLVTAKYGAPKSLWEIAVTRSDSLYSTL